MLCQDVDGEMDEARWAAVVTGMEENWGTASQSCDVHFATWGQGFDLHIG
jgi:hypothetical protein